MTQRTTKLGLQWLSPVLMASALLLGTGYFGAVSGMSLAATLTVVFLAILAWPRDGVRPHLGPLSIGALGLACLGLLQLIVLPVEQLRNLSNQSPLYLGLSSGLQLPISVAPHLTLLAAGQWALMAVALAICIAFCRVPKFRSLLRAASLLALLIVLIWTGGQELLGWQAPSIEALMAKKTHVYPIGPFLNPDHGAGFAVVALFMAVPLLLRANSRLRWTLIPLVLGVGTLIILSNSRGAILAVGTGAIAALLVFFFQKRQWKRIALVLGAMLLCLALATQLMEVLGYLTGKQPNLGPRAQIWSDTWTMATNHPLLGVGLGAYGQAIPQWWTAPGGFSTAHAHNEYLELLAESGVLGLILMGTTLLWAILQSGYQVSHWPREDKRWKELPWSLGAVAAFSAHAVVDLHLHLGAMALLSGIAVASTLALGQGPVQPAAPQGKKGRLWALKSLATVSAMLAIVPMATETWPKRSLDLRVERVLRGPLPYLGCGTQALQQGQKARALRCSKRALALAPHNASAHLLLANAYEAVGEDNLALKHWTRSMSLAPTNWQSHWHLGFYHLRAGETHLSTVQLAKALENSRPARRSHRLEQLWKQPKSLRWLSPLLMQFPKDSAVAAKRLAASHHRNAVAALQWAIALNPQDRYLQHWLVAQTQGKPPYQNKLLSTLRFKDEAMYQAWRAPIQGTPASRENIELTFKGIRRHLDRAILANRYLKEDPQGARASMALEQIFSPSLAIYKRPPTWHAAKLDWLLVREQREKAQKYSKFLVSQEPFRAHYRKRWVKLLAQSDKSTASHHAQLAQLSRLWRPSLVQAWGISPSKKPN